jgi:hypothetical protein
MNIEKGIERIALLIAIMTIIPSFYLGKTITFGLFKRIPPQASSWHDKTTRQLTEPFKISGTKQTAYPLFWQCMLGGFVSASLSFFVVLFGILGFAHLIIRLSFWIYH